ncbi:hypothetical protein RFM26_21460 [Mesorhizobium sp. VK23B]|uniref:Uncharacterized protein n=1 Tax=Mesorhizobium dulcispinae TaxID=3072316 RepID=A0ABU4XKN5_9HYPH|nr:MULTISPECIES: hypothetical protein [unclassified Mesorhizobium]MDX8468270.1 hypothetical protein [Mesorhizobium sp. VK23B]MDX8474608.1 hypothetical protein [Mesorhizobium sp. VK23A]
MTNRNIVTIDGGSAGYWKQQRLGFRLIREAEWALSRLQRAPMYLHGGYDENGDVIPIENLRPYFDMEDAIRAIEANQTAVRILVAQRRTKIGDYEVKAAIWELKDAGR